MMKNNKMENPHVQKEIRTVSHPYILDIDALHVEGVASFYGLGGYPERALRVRSNSIPPRFLDKLVRYYHPEPLSVVLQRLVAFRGDPRVVVWLVLLDRIMETHGVPEEIPIAGFIEGQRGSVVR
jgi:hypothetical protein